jgi:hypothetical protein
MPVIPIHYYAPHDDGKFKSDVKPGSASGMSLKFDPAKQVWNYMVACLGPANEQLPKQVTVEPAHVTCPKCRATEIWKQNYRDTVLIPQEQEEVAGPPTADEVIE